MYTLRDVDPFMKLYTYTRQAAMYVGRKVQARSCNHCCSGKGISITHCECLCVCVCECV